MPKTNKINVLTVKVTVHIPVDPGDVESVNTVAVGATHLHAAAAALGEATMESRLNRVPAPKPAPEASEPALDPGPTEPPDDDGLDIPPALDRRGDTPSGPPAAE